MKPSGEYSRTPYLVVRRGGGPRKDVYGAIDDALVLQAQLMRGARETNTVLIGMHPIGAPAYLPMFSQLARSGHHVIACASRYSGGDAALQMENVLLDLSACVRDARERLGYAKIVLVGWSGGGSLMCGYQAEALQKTITRTAAGEDTPLAQEVLLPADALLLIATHRSRHHLLTGQLDASLLDENAPCRKDPTLDLYDVSNSEKPPYSTEFLARYRAAQTARNRRISAWARERLDALRRAGREHDEVCFVVNGTMADPRWIDASLEPNRRRPNWTYLGEPQVVNNSPAGLARYSSLRSWLSQWSLDDAQIDAVRSGPRISVPVLLITAGADDACPTSHVDQIFDSIAATDKQRRTIEGANHYFTGADGKSHLAETMTVVNGWLQTRGFTG